MTSLIFTVGQNGYGIGYASCIRSHERYAARFNHQYVAVVRPFRVKEPALSAWLKIPLLLHALRSGYEWVAFVDADCRIHAWAPDFRSMFEGDKSVYMANGRSGRVNSGVMFARADAGSIRFFEQVMASITAPISSEDRKNLKYENGNVIHCAQQSRDVETADLRWNNTYEPDLEDYFRHYTGPLRKEYRRSFLSAGAFWLARSLAATPAAQPEARDRAFVQRLEALKDRCCALYPSLSALPVTSVA